MAGKRKQNTEEEEKQDAHARKKQREEKQQPVIKEEIKHPNQKEGRARAACLGGDKERLLFYLGPVNSCMFIGLLWERLF